MIVRSLNEFSAVTSGNIGTNKVIGAPETWENSSILLEGYNNILVFDGNVKLCDSHIKIKGHDSIVYICGAKYSKTRLNLTIYNKSVFFLGRNTATTKLLTVVLSEQRHVFIGANCLFSFDIFIRNSDAHLIYDTATKKRTNPSLSTYIGDHVWIGQEALICKGAKIGSGSIIGARSFVSNIVIPSNRTAVGVPCKVIDKSVFWERPCIHDFDDEKIARYSTCESNAYVYEKDRHTHSFENMEKTINSLSNVDERYEYIKTNFADKYRKNRFFIESGKTKRKPSFFSKVIK